MTTPVDTCPSRSPETQSACVLPDEPDAHDAGHESARVDIVRACWATRPEDWKRWGRRPHE